ncbi:IS630 family transposase [Embleya hyalina]|uniref:IS630 family transposase n=1 Tax=Embleya hyalina TaxID=516124 RepID=A0A401Z5Z1_9ACTN|nr:IS630 family transposase [Embleya hyalina]
MSRPGPKIPPLSVTDAQRAVLEGWLRHRTTAQALAQRSRIVLECAEGHSVMEVSRRLGIAPDTVRTRRRFPEHGLDRLGNEPRPGVPRKITDADVEPVIVKTLEETPKNATHWSTRSMAAATGMSQSTVSGIRRAFALAPHRSQTFKLSTDPLFIDKVRDVVGLYLDPPEKALLLCVDEKSQIQALDRSQPVLPMMPGVPERRSHDYIRAGTTTLFAALEVATGKVIGSLHRRHRAAEFRKFPTKLDKEVPAGLQVHLILDNHATHKTPDIKKSLPAHPRFHLHFTPTSASWLNLVERWFAELTRKKLKRGVHRSVQSLERNIRSWLTAWNEQPRPFAWTKTADDILDKVAASCHRISDSGHWLRAHCSLVDDTHQPRARVHAGLLLHVETGARGWRQGPSSGHAANAWLVGTIRRRDRKRGGGVGRPCRIR